MDAVTRRVMLGRASLMGSALAIEAPTKDSPREVGRRLKVVVAGGHPGDPEYGCGGAIARFSDMGHEVVLLYLNEGEPAGTPPEARGVRVAEAAKACSILKARPLYAGQVDGDAVIDAAHYRAFLTILESERPEAVFTHWPIDNHADHRAISMLVYDAWLKMGRKFALYYYEVSNGEDTVQFAPMQHVDITDTAGRKRLACLAHASQQPDKFVALQERITRFRGIETGRGLAEGYIRHVQGPNLDQPLGFL